jgi:ABC-type transporter MlaC component
MRVLVLAAAAAALFAGSVQAAQPANAEAAARDAAAREVMQTKAERVVYVCDRSELTRRAFAREHGEVKFVTAEQAITGAADDWSAPRCVSEVEAAKLSAMLGR